MISQLFILTPSGDVIANEDYRYDVRINSSDTFFRLLKNLKNNYMPPVIEQNGIKYFHINRDNLYFVSVSANNINSVAEEAFPFMMIELLTRFYNICKDFCGVITEVSIKTNTLLVHEIMREIVNYGYIQISTTEKLKPLIHSEPTAVTPVKGTEGLVHGLFGLEKPGLPSTAANKPVVRTRTDHDKRHKEIFVDVIETIIAVINSDGTVLRSEIHGQIRMKCFLYGQPKIKLALNEDLVITYKDDQKDKGYGSAVHLDNCKFHEAVSLEEMEASRILNVNPSDGEILLMEYQVEKDLPNVLPFQLSHSVEASPASRDMDITLRLRCEIPSRTEALNVTAYLPVPKSTNGLMQQCSGPWQKAEFLSEEKQIVWKIKKFPGGTEAVAKFKLVEANSHKKSILELGPLALEFEVSTYVCSNLQIRFLKVCDNEQMHSLYRWIRYVTEQPLNNQ